MKSLAFVATFALSGLLGCSPQGESTPAAPRSMEFFRVNPDVRKSVLAECAKKANGTRMPECETASFVELQENSKKGVGKK
jgi:hypothetical protein